MCLLQRDHSRPVGNTSSHSCTTPTPPGPKVSVNRAGPSATPPHPLLTRPLLLHGPRPSGSSRLSPKLLPELSAPREAASPVFLSARVLSPRTDMQQETSAGDDLRPSQRAFPGQRTVCCSYRHPRDSRIPVQGLLWRLPGCMVGSMWAQLRPIHSGARTRT